MEAVVRIILNYLIVQAAIILFALPFYAVYRHKHGKGKPVSFNHEIENFFQSRQVNWLVFAWAMSEALIWFVIPEFLLLLLIFMRINRKRELLFYDIYGTAAGTFLALLISLPTQTLAKLPYIQPGMIAQVHHWYNAHGIFGLLYQPFSGVPYKVFNFSAHDYHFFIPLFLLLAIATRLSRYVIFYGIFVTIYPVLHKFVYHNYLKLLLVATFIFSVLLLRVYDLYGPSYQVSFEYLRSVISTLT